MISLLILALSIVLQLTAAVMALRLVKVTGWLFAWIIIATALFLMGARRSVTFYNAIFDELARPPNLSAEIIALLISASMLIGVMLIRPIFIAKRDTENLLREKEATYRGILNDLTDTFIHTNAANRIVNVSESIHALLGYTPDEVINMSITDLYLHSPDHNTFLNQLQKNGGQIRGSIAQWRHKNGNAVLVETNARLIYDDRNNFIGVEGAARDITNRRSSEELNLRLGRIVEDSDNEIYVFDSVTLQFLLVNRGARENLGYSLKEVLEITPVDIKPNYDHESFVKVIEPLKNGEQDFLEFETVHSRKDGSTYSVDVHLQLARSENPPVFFAIIQDTTERKQAEAIMLAAKDEAEQANRAKSEFLANFSHELRTPLNAIIGFSEIMQNKMYGPLGHERYEEYISDIHGSGAHLLSMISEILQYSSLEAGKINLNESEFEVGEVVEECIRLINNMARNKDVQIDLRQPAGDFRIYADQRLLRQILLNLLSNAVKFTQESTVVTLTFDIGETGGAYFHVRDNGKGLHASEIKRIEEPFVRLQGAMTSSEEGTGLGLPITKRLVESHGGALELTSEKGVGTTATVAFPPERTVSEHSLQGLPQHDAETDPA